MLHALPVTSVLCSAASERCARWRLPGPSSAVWERRPEALRGDPAGSPPRVDSGVCGCWLHSVNTRLTLQDEALGDLYTST